MRERGFSMTELLTIVAIIGVIAVITVPALLQLMPQYRIRSAASELAGSIRFVRQQAMDTRRPWKISLDATGEAYAFSMLNTPDIRTVNLADSTKWTKMAPDGRTWITGRYWIKTSAIDLRTNTANALKDVDCDGSNDLIFLRDGSLSDAPNGSSCGGGANLAFTTEPSVALAVSNRFVRFNRYSVTLKQNGKVTITPANE